MHIINSPKRINGQANYEVANYGDYAVAIALTDAVNGEWGWQFDRDETAKTKTEAKRQARARGAKIVKVAW